MADFGESLASLPAMSLRELRLLASRLGLGRYGALTRQTLVESIRRVISRQPAAPQQPSPAPETQVPAPLEDAAAVVSTAVSTSPSQDSTPEPVAVPERSWIVFQPQADQWAEVRWRLSEADRAAALAAGGTSLALRLSDVTGRNDGEALPHALQEVTVDTAGERWYLPIPLAGRSYRVELGYRSGDRNGWIAVIRSSVVHLPEAAPSGSGAAAAQPFDLSLPLVPAAAAMPAAGPASHEQAYQLASGSWRRQRIGSEAFQEGAGLEGAGGAAGAQASGVGLWASGLQESGAGGVPARQRSFWLVADAELIVHAATEPSAQLSIGDQPHPLSEAGTIRLHVPFPDGEQHYPIRALAADGEQHRHVTLSFVRTTPQARVNTREQAVPEWF